MSREKKFTPGPWSIFGADNGLGIAVFSEKNCVAHTRDGATGYDTWKANADLIAAAPELLEALELLHGINRDILSSGGCNPSDFVDKMAGCQWIAFKAIKKAYGETK